jgi:RNA polymerase sigma factor (TIGR02999 family)
LPSPQNGGVTEWLRAAADGDRTASEKVATAIYDALRHIAHREMRHERPDNSMQPTALVNEALMRLLDGSAQRWTDTRHFLSVASRMMRRLLIDHARQRDAAKRNAHGERLPLEGILAQCSPNVPDILELEETLVRLEERDPQMVRIVELRLFAGQSFETIGRVLEIPVHVAKREWKTAQAWLRKELR